MIMLLSASGGKVSLKSFKHQMIAIIIPLGMLLFSYMLFLRSYEIDFSQPIRLFLDFGYPLGQALYVSAAILTYTVSKNILGGIMRKKIIFIIIAFIAQYAADFNFLYQSSRGTWYNGGYGDYLYLVAYFIMVLGILQFRVKYLDID